MLSGTARTLMRREIDRRVRLDGGSGISGGVVSVVVCLVLDDSWGNTTGCCVGSGDGDVGL